MGLVRLIIILLLLVVIWRMFKIYQMKQERPVKDDKVLPQEKMVKCGYCSVHIPQHGALQDDGKWFCDRQHKDLYLRQK